MFPATVVPTVEHEPETTSVDSTRIDSGRMGNKGDDTREPHENEGTATRSHCRWDDRFVTCNRPIFRRLDHGPLVNPGDFNATFSATSLSSGFRLDPSLARKTTRSRELLDAG